MDAWTPERIKQLRKALEATQKAFAEMVGVTREYVNHLEKGVKIPSKTLCILFTCMEKKTKKESDERGKNERDL